MKLPPNGGINLSILDGWWCEGYNEKNGWAIGSEILDGSPEFQNKVDSTSLYQLLESQIVPLYYTKPDGNIPTAWIEVMKESMRTVTPVYNTERMVSEYNERFYEPAAAARKKLSADNCAPASQLSEWKESMRSQWHQVRIDDVTVDVSDRFHIPVGETAKVTAKVHIGTIKPEDIRVEAYYGETDDRDILSPQINELECVDGPDPSDFLYA
jgi:starch phosphorylase